MSSMDGGREEVCVEVPVERTDDAVTRFVVMPHGDGSAADDVIAFCRKNLAAYKVPRQIDFIDELPKSPVGKILRRELRD